MDKVTYEQALEALKTVKAFCGQKSLKECFYGGCELKQFCKTENGVQPCDWELEE